REAHIAMGASESQINVSKLNPEKCTSLKMEVGAADFEASGLGNLNCDNVDLDGGVGDVTLDFNGAWRGNTDVSIDMGLGSLTLRLPRGLGVFIKKQGFLSSFDSEGLVKRGGNYYSENYENASNKISINIDAAFGSIRIVWVTPDGDFRRAAR
ncbi:MAG TPA: LiaF domain-containing protein, partial [Longimicrobiales bacterium]|nr:LiaF domain-containing protein [Longimicrobiales bacterium]